MATRADAIASARQHLHSGEFLDELNRRVSYRTESQNSTSGAALRAYLEEDLQPSFSALDCSTRLIESPTGRGPDLLADYREDASLPTVLTYGHGDVVDGMVGEWRDDLNPWQTTTRGERVYGRGTADNKGQHSINLAALRAVRETRGGKLGFNAKFIIETGEEIGSPDLRQGASRCAASCLPICFWPPTGHGFPPIGPRSSSAVAAESVFISTSTCAMAGIIPAIGAGCSPTPPRFLQARSRALSITGGACCWSN
jgi:acetylornithine deacetylase/succinyl-diaminopimelate desuccinylase-like protein